MSQLLERKAMQNGGLTFNQLDVVLDDVITHGVTAGKSFGVELDQVLHSRAVHARLSIVVGKILELAIHLVVEVANQEVRPELIEDIEVVGTSSSSSLLALGEGLDS